MASIGYMTVCSCYPPNQLVGLQQQVAGKARTAIPAKAPAAMFWSREKFGGRDS